MDVADGEIPEETAGPYPGDGSNGPNVLTESGIVRSDITTSFGDATGVAEGVPLTVKLKVYDLNGTTPRRSPAPRSTCGTATAKATTRSTRRPPSENYLRGVQEAADDGSLEFTTIFPACYAGRWPHMHFEVYESLDAATNATNKLRTSQLALTQDVCETVYATEGYEQASATWPRSASTATASSPTATPSRWPRSPAPSRTGTSPPSTSRC